MGFCSRCTTDHSTESIASDQTYRNASKWQIKWRFNQIHGPINVANVVKTLKANLKEINIWLVVEMNQSQSVIPELVQSGDWPPIPFNNAVTTKTSLKRLKYVKRLKRSFSLSKMTLNSIRDVISKLTYKSVRSWKDRCGDTQFLKKYIHTVDCILFCFNVMM